MSQQLPGASLQNFNNQIVQTLQGLKDKRDDLISQIEQAKDKQRKLQSRAIQLSQNLSSLNSILYLESLQQKIEARNDFDRAIHDTESAYVKILQSSQTLLHVIKRESVGLTKKVSERNEDNQIQIGISDFQKEEI